MLSFDLIRFLSIVNIEQLILTDTVEPLKRKQKVPREVNFGNILQLFYARIRARLNTKDDRQDPGYD